MVETVLEVSGLTVARPGGDAGRVPAEPAVENVSFSLVAETDTALVGPNGAGKSTLVQALLGLYPLREGRIRYGGVDVAEVGWDRVREHVGVVLQHPVLFNASAAAAAGGIP